MSPALSSLPGLESCKHRQPPFTNTNEDPKETITDISGGHQWSLSSAASKGISTARYSSNPYPVKNIDTYNGISSTGPVLLWTEEFNWSKIQSVEFNSTNMNSGDQFCCSSVDLPEAYQERTYAEKICKSQNNVVKLLNWDFFQLRNQGNLTPL